MLSFFFSSCALFPESGCEKRLRHPPLLLFCISALTYLKFVAESQNLIPQKSVCGGIFFISPRPLLSTKVTTLRNAFLKHTQIKISLQGDNWKHLCEFCPLEGYSPPHIMPKRFLGSRKYNKTKKLLKKG